MKRTLLIVAAVTPWLAGCVATAPEWEGNFGDAARQTRAAQVIDPDAPTRNTGPGSTDGKAVAGAQAEYAKTFGYAVKEPSKPAVSISTTIAK